MASSPASSASHVGAPPRPPLPARLGAPAAAGPTGSPGSSFSHVGAPSLAAPARPGSSASHTQRPLPSLLCRRRPAAPPRLCVGSPPCPGPPAPLLGRPCLVPLPGRPCRPPGTVLASQRHVPLPQNLQNGLRMSRRLKQVSKGFAGKMIPNKSLFQGTSNSSASRRKALLRVRRMRRLGRRMRRMELGIGRRMRRLEELRRRMKRLELGPRGKETDQTNRQWEDVTWDVTSHHRAPNDLLGNLIRVHNLGFVEEYGKEMVMRHGEGFDWRNAPIDAQVLHFQRHDRIETSPEAIFLIEFGW
ncbi:hypothetical protein U9M48_019719 [Paspalum notatum var. saurae]|uniref:Uncharacterized protein n=1 Tax=Paspalum notatum var. saurae TaxID=547442 RepID=A0AAQ3WR76_PASNO